MEKTFNENYAYPPGSNGKFAGHPVKEMKTGQPVSAYNSSSFQKSFNIRTDYDKYWLTFYNQKSANFPTDLLTMEFL